MKTLLITIYCVVECVVCGLVFLKRLICCVKIVNNCPALLEYYPSAIVKVYIDKQVQFGVDGNPELGRHYSKGGYILKECFIWKNFKR